MTTTRFPRSSICTALAAAILSAAATMPASAVEKAGDVVSVRGKAVVERQAGKVDARVALALMESDSVATRERSRIKMLFRDDSVLTLGANSRLVIRKYLHGPGAKRAESIYELADGRLRSVVGSSGFKVTTPTAFAAARGTVFTVFYDPEKGTTEIRVFEGMVEVRNSNARIAGAQIVTAGHSTTVSASSPPTKPVDIRGGGSDDDAALDMPGLLAPPEGAQHIINDLHFLAEHSLKPGQPIEQEPANAATRVFLNVQFPP